MFFTRDSSSEAVEQIGPDLPGSSRLSADPPLKVNGISKSLGGEGVLNDISFDVSAGEVLVVLGPSGSGKTTLLRIIAGLCDPDRGEIHLRERNAHLLSPQQRRLGVVFQDYALFRQMTVEENIAFGLRIRKLSRAEVKRSVDELVVLMRLEPDRQKYPSQLSGGQRQRVALARAIACNPDAMLIDEAFSALDAPTRVELRREVCARLRAMNIPSLLITHDQEEALEVGDRILVLNNGNVEQIGTPYEIYNHPRNEFVATFLGAANVLIGRWSGSRIAIGPLRLHPTPDAPLLSEGQQVKIVFRPEDAVLNFSPPLLDTPYYLGRATIEDIWYAGHGERVMLRLMLWEAKDSSDLVLVDEMFAQGLPLIITRSKWEVSDMELSVGDEVAIGLKAYRLLPYYPLRGGSSLRA